MRHILIILSFLLLSSPLFGQETGVLYLYESSSGVVLKSFGNEKVQPKYEGEIIIGKPDGFGVLTYPYNEKSVVGEWKNGKEWNTKHTKKDGTFIGKFENGEWIVSWGDLYIGYRNGKIGWYEEEWEGVETEEDKDISKYEGEIKNGFPNGQGTLTYPDGSKYVGEVEYGSPYGQGTETLSDGRKYVGEFKDGKFHGQGTETLSDGDKYVGTFKSGKKHGQGTFTWSDGKNYVGEYKGGLPNGQGKYTSPDGYKYAGEWKDGKRNGHGTYTDPDGSKYVGEIKDGEKHGQGIFTWSDGTKYVGEYKDGKTWNGTGYNKNGEIIFPAPPSGRPIYVEHTFLFRKEGNN